LGKKKIYYGWWVVFACFILMSSGMGILVNTFTIFLKPVIEDLNFSRSEFSLCFTIAHLAAMFITLFLGKLINKNNIRFIMLLSCIGAGIGYIFYSNAHSLIGFYLISILIGLAQAGMTIIPISIIISNWFVEKRGFALGLTFAGSGVGGMFYCLVANWLILIFGWRMAYLFLGISILLTTIPVLVFIIKGHPSEKGLEPFGKVNNENQTEIDTWSLTFSNAIKTKAFWTLGFAMLIMGIINTGIQSHIFAYFTDLGYSSVFTTNIISFSLIMLVLGKIILGVIFDKYGSEKGVIYSCSFLFCTAVLLLKMKFIMFTYLFSIFFGLGASMATVMAPYLTRNIFGPTDYKIIFGPIHFLLTFGFSIGTPLSGLVYDILGSYKPIWITYSVFTLILMFALLLSISQGKKLRFYQVKESKIPSSAVRS